MDQTGVVEMDFGYKTCPLLRSYQLPPVHKILANPPPPLSAP